MSSTGTQRGFTLVELIVTLSVLALLSALLLGAVQLTGRARSAAEANSDMLGRALQAQGFLRSQLTQLVADRSVDTGGQPGFRGGASYFSFQAPWLTSVGQGAVFVFEVEMQGSDLIVSWRPAGRQVRPGIGSEVEVTGSRTLARNVASMTLEYFGRPGQGEPARWLSDWSRQRSVPQLVRLSVTFSDGAAGLWPPLVVRLPT